MFSTAVYIKRLKDANIAYEKSGTGAFKGDYYVTGGSSTPHIHVGSAGLFVGLKGKKGAITTLVNQGEFKIDTINGCIDELKDSLAPNDVNITNTMKELARQYKFGG